MTEDMKCSVCGSPVGWGTPVCPVCGSALEWEEVDEDQPDAYLMPPGWDGDQEQGERQPWEEYLDRLEGSPRRRRQRIAALGLAVAIILMVVLIVVWGLRL